jgi:predicted Zn-dependent peptidase
MIGTRTAFVLVVLAVLGALAACAGDGASQRRETVRAPPKEEAFRKQRPPAGPDAELQIPAVQKAELKNGLTILLIESTTLPVVRASLVVRAGAADESAKEAGLASLTYDVLDEAAGSLNALALADAFANLGASFDTTVTADGGRLSVSLMKRHVDKGLELLSLVAQKPSFTNDDFDRVKKEHLADLRQREGEPAGIARAALWPAMYGVEHPYGHVHEGTTATVDKLTVRQAKKFWSDNIGPKSSALVIAGDLSLDEAKALGEKHFGKWKGGQAPRKPPTKPTLKQGTRIYIADFPGAQQTVVRVGRAWIAPNDPGEPAAQVFLQILGGPIVGRLDRKLREEKGWTYGSFAAFAERAGIGAFVAGADVQTPDTVAALQELFAILEKVKTDGVTEPELAGGRAALLRSLPGLLGSTAAQVHAAGNLFETGLSPDYFRALPDKLKAVTAGDVKLSAESAIKNEELVAVLVGDRALLLPKLKEAGLGDVIMLSRDGTPTR